MDVIYFCLRQMVLVWELFQCPPDGFALRVGVFESHLLQFAASVQLVVASVRLLPQVLHVDTDQHFPQLHKVAVVLVLHWQA